MEMAINEDCKIGTKESTRSMKANGNSSEVPSVLVTLTPRDQSVGVPVILCSGREVLSNIT